MGQDKLEAATGSCEESGNVGVARLIQPPMDKVGGLHLFVKGYIIERIFQRYMYSDKRSSGYEHMSVFHPFWVERERKK